MVYNGLWFTPLREALDAFFDKVSETDHRRSHAAALQGQHRAGQPQDRRIRSTRWISPASPWAPSTTRRTRCGFINLIGLPIKVRALAEESREARTDEALGRPVRSGPVGSLRALLRLAAFRPAADRRRYPRLAGVCAGAGARRHSDGRGARRSSSPPSTQIREEARDARVLRRRDRRRRPHPRHPQAEGAGRARWRTRSTPAAAATSRSRSISGCGCASEIDRALGAAGGADAGAARSAPQRIRTP